MSEQVLVPLDSSPLSQRALDHVLANHDDTHVTILHVIDPVTAAYEPESIGMAGAEKWYERAKERAGELLAEAETRAAEAGVEVTTETGVGRPAHVILEYVEDHDLDLVVMGSHGRTGVSRLLLGSVAEQVARRSPVPVTVIR